MPRAGISGRSNRTCEVWSSSKDAIREPSRSSLPAADLFEKVAAREPCALWECCAVQHLSWQGVVVDERGSGMEGDGRSRGACVCVRGVRVGRGIGRREVCGVVVRY